MSAHASQAFSIAHCTDSEDLPKVCAARISLASDGGASELICEKRAFFPPISGIVCNIKDELTELLEDKRPQQTLLQHINTQNKDIDFCQI